MDENALVFNFDVFHEREILKIKPGGEKITILAKTSAN